MSESSQVIANNGVSALYRRGKKGLITYIHTATKTWRKTGTANLLDAQVLQNKWDRQLFYSQNGLVDKEMMWSGYREKHMELYSSNAADNTVVKLNYILNSFERVLDIKPAMKIAAISMEDCETWQARRLKEVAPQTVDTEQKYLKAFFSKAHQRKYIDGNPFADVAAVNFISPEAKSLSLVESAKFLEALKEEPAHELLGQFIYWTGMRRDEAAHQRIEDVDFARGLVLVKNHDAFCTCHQCSHQDKPGWATKTGLERAVPMVPSLSAALLAFRQTKATGCIFSLHPLTITEVFKRAYKRAGVGGKVAAHTLRHTFANDMRQAGVDILVRKAILGHAKTSSHETYMHVSPVEMQLAVQKLTDWRTGNPSAVKRTMVSGLEIVEAAQ